MTTTLAFILFAAIYLLLMWKAGKTYPILYLFLFTYFLQYIFSTQLIYDEYQQLSRQMPIPDERYFDYVNMAMLFLFAGIFTFNRDIDVRSLLNKIDPKAAAGLGWLLLFVSYFFAALQMIGIPGVGSVISFTQYLIYPAAFCFLLSTHPFKYLLVVLIFVQLLFTGLQGGMFLNLFVWSTYLFFFVTHSFRLSFFVRAAIFLLGIPVLIVVQSVKDEYRKATWVNRREAGIGLFADIASSQNEKTKNVPFIESPGVVKTVGRLTQGWHLGLTLRRVPSKVPLSNGEEMVSDITSSILPRIVVSDKKIVGSQDKFEKYTGHRLWNTTSMTIGVIGDFYINFGKWGSFAGLFIFGAFISLGLYFFMKRFVIPDPINIVWVPFIFSYLIRANNDFYMVFNSLIKGLIIFLVVNYIRKKWWSPKPVSSLQR